MTEKLFFYFVVFWSFAICVYWFKGPFAWTNPIGELQPPQNTCQWPPPDGKGGDALEDRQKLPLLINIVWLLSVPVIFCQEIKGFWNFIIWCLKAIFLRHWHKVTLNYLYRGSWQQIRPSLPPYCRDLLHNSLSSIFVRHKERFLKCVNSWNKPHNLGCEADWAGASISVSLLSCLMQIWRYFCCLGRDKKQWHPLTQFHSPYNFNKLCV